jgi:hypothetical protein
MTVVHGAAFLDSVDGPVLAFAEEGSGGHFQHVVGFPDDDPRLDPVAVSRPRGGSKKPAVTPEEFLLAGSES